ncbi:MAG: DUF3802 family protein [Idiomarina sp.]
MIVETDGYIDLIQYLTENLPVLSEQQGSKAGASSYTLRECFEEQLSVQIMSVCQQNDLDQTMRIDIVREADAILYDFEEVLASVLDNHPTPEQEEFVTEFIGLIKNLFDARVKA